MSRPVATRRLGRALTDAWYEPHPTWPRRLLLSTLTPAAWAFAAASRLRGAAYSRGWLGAARAPLPVVSVGNLAVGGAGKTPVVLHLAETLAARGEVPAVLTRGYGASRKDVRLVADAGGPKLGVAEAGDEPVLLARRAPGLIVLAGSDRIALAHAAAERGATVALLDDGLQHRRLARDLDVVVLDASAPLGNGRRLPRGPLREGPEALARAHLLWLSRVDEAPARALAAWAEIDALMSRFGLPVVRSRYRATALCDPEGRIVEPADTLRGRRVVALSGVARPQSFLHTLSALGARIEREHAFGDHHAFSAAELARVREEAKARGAVVVTTEKDAVRLPEGTDGVLALRIEVEIVDGEDALRAVLEKALS